MRKIFAKLREAELINTKSGKGRPSLARSAEEITMWDIFCAVEDTESDHIFTVHDCADCACKVGSHVGEVLRPHYAAIVDAMRTGMSSITLSALGSELDKIPSK